MTMEPDSLRGVGRRRLIKAGGVAAAGVVVGVPLVDAGVSRAGTTPTPSSDRIPPATLPGGAYDTYVAGLAAAGRFSGTILLSYRGRTVLSRSYGMANREKKISNTERTAFSLSSAGKPFNSIAVMQLAQQGKLQLTDTVGQHLTGFAPDIAAQVTIHHMLIGASGMAASDPDAQRVFQSVDEVQEYYQQFARQAKLVAPVGTPTSHASPDSIIPGLIVEAVSGKPYWDYVRENIFKPSRMTGSGFFTRPQWLSDGHVAHPYMTLADGSVVDALTHLNQGSSRPELLGKNPGRAFVDAPGDGGFVTAPDLVKFGHALLNGTLLDRTWTDVVTGPNTPIGPGAFGAYLCPISMIGDQWMYERAGANPGVGANWDIYPYTGWVGVILSNTDDAPLVDMIDQEMLAVTGVSAGGGGGG